jgi:hypothetical protein
MGAVSWKKKRENHSVLLGRVCSQFRKVEEVPETLFQVVISSSLFDFAPLRPQPIEFLRGTFPITFTIHNKKYLMRTARRSPSFLHHLAPRVLNSTIHGCQRRPQEGPKQGRTAG